MTTKQFIDRVEAIQWPIVKITWKDGTTEEGYLTTSNCFTWYLSIVERKTYIQKQIKLYPSKIKKIEVIEQ